MSAEDDFEEFCNAIEEKFHGPWRKSAACAGLDPEMFQNPDLYAEGKKVCVTCPVRVECLDNAIHFNDGLLRGGLTEKERNSVEMHRKRHLAAFRHDFSIV